MILWISNDCVGFSDNSGSSTSSSIWNGLNRDMEEKVIVARDCLPPEPRCPLPRDHRGGQSRATIPFSSMSRFMFFRESKPKLISPNSFSTMAEITPTIHHVVIGRVVPRRRARCQNNEWSKYQMVVRLTSWAWTGLVRSSERSLSTSAECLPTSWLTKIHKIKNTGKWQT